MKKFTQLGKPFQSGISGLWYVPAVKVNGYYLTTLGDVELMNISLGNNADIHAFNTEHQAVLTARAYYTYHGFVYPHTSSEEVEELLETIDESESQVMGFI